MPETATCAMLFNRRRGSSSHQKLLQAIRLGFDMDRKGIKLIRISNPEFLAAYNEKNGHSCIYQYWIYARPYDYKNPERFLNNTYGVMGIKSRRKKR